MLDEKILSIYESETHYPADKTVCEYIYEIAEQFPDRTAVVYEEESITFEELNRKSNQLGWQLREAGVKPNTFVALLMNHSIEMIIAILGVIKAGGAYVPINAYDASSRQQYIFENSESRILLTNLEQRSIDAPVTIMFDKNELYGCQENLDILNTSNDLLYLIYTSGSTGKPKGAMIEHHNLLALLKNDDFQYQVDENDTWTLFHSYAFDFSVLEMFGALLSGAKLLILDKQSREDMNCLLDTLVKDEVTVLCLVPSVFYNLADVEIRQRKLKLKYLILGGESLNMEKLRGWFFTFPDLQIVNVYGITETTVINISNFISEKDLDGGISNIGHPMPGCTTYIMDGKRICELGEAGEICICGGQVGRGYLKMEELTAARFTENPFRQGERMYYSGDLAVMLPDRSMKYLGRADNQVKIRGFRIELEEIENCIRGLESVNNAVVDTYEYGSSSDIRLVGYVSFITLENTNQQLLDLKNSLKQLLPYYMNPSSWIIVDEMPINANGKADKKRLKELSFDRAGFSNEFIPAENETQQDLVAYWEELFEMMPIGVADSFFELGGHSFLVIQLIDFIKNKFGCELSFSQVIEDDTIQGISEKIIGAAQLLEDQNKFVTDPEKRYEPFELLDLQQAYYIGRQQDTRLGGSATQNLLRI